MAPTYDQLNYWTTATESWWEQVSITYTTPETKKQREARIAAERMYASWSVYNMKTLSLKDVKQICKPRHLLNYSGRRY